MNAVNDNFSNTLLDCLHVLTLKIESKEKATQSYRSDRRILGGRPNTTLTITTHSGSEQVYR
jgi:hypothetical protein